MGHYHNDVLSCSASGPPGRKSISVPTWIPTPR